MNTAMQRNPVVMVQAGSLLQQSFWHRAAADDISIEQVVTPPKKAYDIARVLPENYEDVMNFLRRNFFRDEPLNVYLNLVPTSEPGACPELEEFAMSSIVQGVSLMAVTPCGRVIGASINAISHPEDVHELQKTAEECSNEKFKIILGLLSLVEKESNVHERFGVDSVFELPILSVDSTFRGQGVATALFNGSVQLAKRLGYPVMRVDCSSEFTARAAIKLGFQKIFSMRYDQYKRSQDEVPPLQPAAPHHEIKAYALRLNA